MSVLCQVEATRYTGGWTTFANTEKTWAYRQDQLPSTHPIAADIPDIEAVKVNFDGITYAKGASVLKQLVAWVGQDAFMSGLREYFRKHEFANTELRDLLTELETSSGRDLKAWTEEWLQTAGVNTLRATFETNGEGIFTSFSLLQESTDTHPTLRSHRVAVGLYDLVDGSLVRSAREELDVVGAKTDVPALIGRKQPDLVLVNDDDLTYSKIRLDERSLQTLVDHVGDFQESLPRALCWAAAWDMTRDAEIPARDYVKLVLAGIGGEDDIGVVQSLLRQAQSAVTLFSDPAWAPSGRAALAEAAYDAMSAAEPGSDLQLAWTRALGAVCTDPAHLALLRGLLDGSRQVDGLSVDAELRWHLLYRLVVLGEAGDDEIEAELQRDPTAAGQRHAAASKAARPTAEAKADAWQRAVEDESLPNAVQAAIIGGFWNAEQTQLCEAYVEKYFEVIGDVWRDRTAEMAQQIVIGLYPTLLVSPKVVERTDVYLEDPEVPPSLRRLLLESRDGVLRALRARARDSATTLRCVRLIERSWTRSDGRKGQWWAPWTASSADFSSYAGNGSRLPAASANWRKASTMPPARSPPLNAVVIDSTASEQTRSGTRRRTRGPVTTSTRRWPGATTMRTAAGDRSGPRAACNRSAAARNCVRSLTARSPSRTETSRPLRLRQLSIACWMRCCVRSGSVLSPAATAATPRDVAGVGGRDGCGRVERPGEPDRCRVPAHRRPVAGAPDHARQQDQRRDHADDPERHEDVERESGCRRQAGTGVGAFARAHRVAVGEGGPSGQDDHRDGGEGSDAGCSDALHGEHVIERPVRRPRAVP
jgi:hypothetical protein